MDAAAKGERIIYDHELLMVRSTGGVVVIQTERKACMGLPFKFHRREPFSFQCVYERKIPAKYVDIQVWCFNGFLIEISTQRNVVGCVVFSRSNKPDPAVNVPTADINSVPSVINGFNKFPVIGIRINQKRKPLRFPDAPAVFAFL